MEIQRIQVLKGPNIWSIKRKKLIQMRLDLQDLEQRPSNTIPGFRERIEQMIPSLYEHRCSEGHKGGFFERVKDGTWMGHIIEHIALEIQTLAGMFSGFGRTRSTNTPGVYNVVFSYVEEQVGVYAAKAAVRIAEALIAGTAYDLEKDIMEMRKLRDDVRFGPSTGSIIDEATARNIPYIRLNSGSLIQLGHGRNQIRLRATITDRTSNIAVDIACNKEETKRILNEQAIPVAQGMTVSSKEGLERAVSELGFPLVFKPLNGNHGRGATINVKNMTDAEAAFEHARKISPKVIAERFIQGHDFRVLVIDYKMVAAAMRKPAHVIGDGINNIRHLIDKENSDPRRGYGHENVLTEIVVDHDTESLLQKTGYTLDSIPHDGEVVYLKSTANLSTGGTSVDVTDLVHPLNVFVCERIAKVIGLDICGIDIMAANLSEPLKDTGGVVLEVNAAPGFRMHLSPSEGTPRNVAAPVLDMLYPAGRTSRIPIIAVTGTNGKTTTTRLISHIIRNNGYRVGYTTSDGIYIHDSLLKEGDTTGPASAAFVLQDPTVEFAVLETARGGILRAGLGFDNCDIAVLTNIQEDHLGISDINTLADLQRVKSVLIESVKADGWAILNADDEHCLKIGQNTNHCNVAYFSTAEENKAIADHCRKGGTAAFVEKGFITIKKGSWKIPLVRVDNIPITYGGTVTFMVQNALAAGLAAYSWGFKVSDIRSAMENFLPSVEHTPGRMNLFDFQTYKILVDYAHNPDGLLGIKPFILSTPASIRTGVISGTGDRRDDDIRKMGRIAAGIFDKIVICQERYLRGRTGEEISKLLTEGVREVNADKPVTVLRNSEEVWKFIIDNPRDGELITIISNTVENAYQKVNEHYQSNKKIELKKSS
ncbi:cyanophycin synthetase [Arcticibacter pallidicorallinus]|uniref:Cyanophycin synthetase n=1 Tax=Arcticibacter pallidicorallinus TaxID=1259464 RepID=A0A2T0U7H3_9SPHI|nr:cyanophycin synthetase [Arcticibacter pallidicorallinus]PRY53871.1 cyanophycin synthetase [Arcticibacter pallidicorallinus]